jgi:hypothetical protein
MDMVRRRQVWVCGFVVALLLVSGLAAGGTTGPSQGVRATVHMTEGRDTASFRLHEPSGVILLYRIDAPAGAKVRASAQLPSVTVPLQISTSIAGACTHARNRVICTIGEEWCPMPEGVWQVRITKLSGPAGGVTLTFKVDQPPGARA